VINTPTSVGRAWCGAASFSGFFFFFFFFLLLSSSLK
jgi:hypothetical protein